MSLADSIRPLPGRPIVLTEAGARLILKQRIDLETCRQAQALKDSTIAYLNHTIRQKDAEFGRINRQQQATGNLQQQAEGDGRQTRQQLRMSRLENWSWRIGVVVFVAAKFGLFR
ncbi:hypothetical protein BLX24_03650 [Arsenicibacter rosenii]|uniref:Uncharacterized protein n=2 Tax=Arsenicibacter rosenii TaxID=1750698 RepID=A0A1S2VSA7_9BACT|nr:hypothetical protein BLX24_03650 [Arsenicibacter rosenii]